MTSGSKKTKKLTMLAMLCAISYVAILLGKLIPPMIPIAPFLTYDPKDIIIAIGGFIFGPLSVVAVATVVSTIEMLTISSTGVIGLVMNVLSTCAFACTAALIYKKKHTLSGAVIGLITGTIVSTVIMVLWNYLLTPLYMGVPRQAVVDILVPAILPFNLIQGGLNTALTLIIYKPLVTALRKIHLIESANEAVTVKKNNKIGLMLFSFLLLATCIMVILALQGKL